MQGCSSAGRAAGSCPVSPGFESQCPYRGETSRQPATAPVSKTGERNPPCGFDPHSLRQALNAHVDVRSFRNREAAGSTPAQGSISRGGRGDCWLVAPGCDPGVPAGTRRFDSCRRNHCSGSSTARALPCRGRRCGFDSRPERHETPLGIHDLLPMRRQGVLRDREELRSSARQSPAARFSEASIGLRARCEGRDFFTCHVCGRGFESRRRQHPFGTDVVAQLGRAH